VENSPARGVETGTHEDKNAVKRAAKKDANQGELVAAVRKLGASVTILSAPGLPDLLVGFRHHNFLFEVKTPDGETTPAQDLFFATWRGQARVVQTLDEIREVLGC
jgi:hypothetical protein